MLGLCPYAMLFCFITENDFCSVIFLFPEAIFKKILFNSDLTGISKLMSFSVLVFYDC